MQQETVKGASLWKDAWKRLLKNKLAVFGMIVIVLMIIIVSIGPPLWEKISGNTFDYQDVTLTTSQPPSLKHPMGTDDSGRDIFARVMQGGRISIIVGIISTIVSLLVGVSYGATAGYLGGRIDGIMMRIVDGIYSIPYILVVIVLMAAFGSSNPADWVKAFTDSIGAGQEFAASFKVTWENWGIGQGLVKIFLMFFALGLVSWLTMARVVRGQVLSLKNQEFILAAKATGVSTAGIIFRHLVPNTLGPVIVYATLTIPAVMLTESFLSFLGIGVQAPYASWGSLANDGIKNIQIFPWQLIFPGVTMALTLYSLNFFGDGLRDALDPQTRKF